MPASNLQPSTAATEAGDGEPSERIYQQARNLHRAGKIDEAVALYLQAIDGHARPGHVFNDLGVALRAKGLPHAAIACYRRALADDNDADDSWSNLANASRQIGDREAALDALDRAREIAPGNPAYMFTRGVSLRETGRLDEAEAQFLELLAVDDDAENNFQLGVTRLQKGDYRRGFAGYEHRLEVERLNPRKLDAPLWDGNDLAGRTLLVHAEQGLGDMMQFARFLRPLAAHCGGTIVGEVHPPLLRLFEASFPAIAFAAVGDAVPMHHVRAPLPSLPHMLGVGADALETATPYLAFPENCRDAVPVLRDSGCPRIGLTWSGNKSQLDRSCPFEIFKQIASTPGADFYSFQRGEAAAEIAAHGLEESITDLGSTLTDFADDAAVLDQLDLVITIDTSICHLAGAMNVPCWTLLTDPADWRYLTEREDSHWYPSMRLFRGPAPAGWPPIVERAAAALGDLVAKQGRRGTEGR